MIATHERQHPVGILLWVTFCLNLSKKKTLRRALHSTENAFSINPCIFYGTIWSKHSLLHIALQYSLLHYREKCILCDTHPHGQVSPSTIVISLDQYLLMYNVNLHDYRIKLYYTRCHVVQGTAAYIQSVEEDHIDVFIGSICTAGKHHWFMISTCSTVND